MPQTLYECYNVIFSRVTGLTVLWSEFRLLFAERENVELFNSIAPSYFRLVQDAMVDKIALGLCKLTDPPTHGKNGKFENLTLDRLVAMASAESPHNATSLQKHCLKSKQLVSVAFRHWRNRFLAHSDLHIDSNPLPTATISDFEQSIREVQLTVKLVGAIVGFENIDFERTITPHGGAKELLAFLTAHRPRP